MANRYDENRAFADSNRLLFRITVMPIAVRLRLSWWLAVSLCLSFVALCPAVHAQNNPGNGPAGGIRPTRKFPSETYYNSKPFLFNGDYDDAATGYRGAMQNGRAHV